MFERLEAVLREYPVLVAGPAPDEQIEAIEAFAAFSLPEDYRLFVERFGSAIVGPFPVYGIGAAMAMGSQEASVIDVTKRSRADRWPGSAEGLVISADHAGNAFTMVGGGQIHRFDHDAGVTEMISATFEGFVDWCLSN